MGDPEARKTELLFAALNARDVDKVRRILTASEELVGAVCAVDADVKWRPLQVAAHIGDLPLVRCLVERFQALRAEKPSCGLRSKSAWKGSHSTECSSLHIALDHGHVLIAEYLIEQLPAEFQNADARGDHLCRAAGGLGLPSVVMLMEKPEYDVNQRNLKETPLIACLH